MQKRFLMDGLLIIVIRATAAAYPQSPSHIVDEIFILTLTFFLITCHIVAQVNVDSLRSETSGSKEESIR